AGLPIAYKDLVPTKGIRTTFGSPIYADHVPTENHAIVDRLSAAGAITIGKTNTPEFGAGSQTFNAVFGVTRNPYDLSKTCGGHRRARTPAENLQAARLRRRRGRARSIRRYRGVPHTARTRLPRSAATAAQASRQAEGHGDLEHRGRSEAHRRENRAGE